MKTRWEITLILRMKVLERRQRWCFCVFIVICEHISLFVQIAGSQRASNVCWVHIEKKNTFDKKIGYLMRYFVVF